MKFKNRKKGIKKWLIYFIFCGFLTKLLGGALNKKNRNKIKINFKDFIEEEKDEIDELVEGKQCFKKFCCDSGSIIKDYFIPYEKNDHKPKILRSKSLTIIVVALFLLKAVLSGYLFFVYPNQARMTELMGKQILELTNADRIANGLTPLTENNYLTQAALVKAQDMLDYQYFAHKSLNGKMPWDWLNREEYAYLFVGENLAINFTSAKSAHNALMLSESHKKNILNNKYNEMGVAVVSGIFDNKKTNILVEIFAAEKPSEIVKIAQVKEAAQGKIAPPASVLPVSDTVADNAAKQESTSEQTDKNSSEQTTKIIEEPAVKNEIEIKEEQVVPEINEKIEKPQSKITIKPKEAAVSAAPTAVLGETNQEEYVSPNQVIENNELVEKQSFSNQTDKKIAFAAKIVKTANYVFIVFLLFIIVSLLINIIIRVRVQHKTVIIQTLLVIVFIVSLIYTKLYFVERIFEEVNII